MSLQSEIAAKAGECLQKANECFDRYEQIKSKNSPEIGRIVNEISRIISEIEGLRERAGSLAEQFRYLYSQASDAYLARDGAGAKALSLQGHEAQNACETINAQIALFLQEIKDLRARKSELINEIERWRKQGIEFVEAAKALRKRGKDYENIPMLFLQGMPEEYQITIVNLLRALPGDHVSRSRIAGVLYSPKVMINEKTGGQIEAQSRYVRNRKPEIVIYNQGKKGFVNHHRLQIAVAHEIGHIIYRHLLNQEQRARWSDLRSSIVKREGNSDTIAIKDEELFAEAYSYYFYEPKFPKQMPELHKFIQDIIGQ